MEKHISQVKAIEMETKQQLPPTTKTCHLALWFLVGFCFSFCTLLPQEEEKQKPKNHTVSPPNCSAQRCSALRLPDRQVTISGDGFTIQCDHPPALKVNNYP